MKTKIIVIFLAIFYTNILHSQTIANGDFESGPSSGWVIYSSNGAGLIGTAEFFASSSIDPPVAPRSGIYMGRIGGFSYAQNSLSQTVTLPSTPNVYLKLYYQSRVSTTSECAGLWVGAKINFIVSGVSLLETYLCHYNQVNEWTYGYFDISAIAGQTVEIVFRAEAANTVWSFLYLDDITISSTLTDIDSEELTPDKLQLSQNYPNPFNPSTVIGFQLSAFSNVVLKVFDVLGNEVATLVNEEKEPGVYEVEFPGVVTGLIPSLHSGVYFYQLRAGDFVETKKMILLR